MQSHLVNTLSKLQNNLKNCFLHLFIISKDNHSVAVLQQRRNITVAATSTVGLKNLCNGLADSAQK